MTTMPALASIGSHEHEIDDYDGQPVSSSAGEGGWQSMSNRNALRRQEEQGAEVERFDWSQVDPTTYWD